MFILHLHSKALTTGMSSDLSDLSDLPPPADRPWWWKCSGTRHRSAQTGCCHGWFRALSTQSVVRTRSGRCVWSSPPTAPTLPGSSWVRSSRRRGKRWFIFFNVPSAAADVGRDDSLTFYLSRAGGSSHCQHLALLQIEADVFEDGRDVKVGEEEPGVTVWMPVCFALLLDLLKQLTDALQRENTKKKNRNRQWKNLTVINDQHMYFVTTVWYIYLLSTGIFRIDVI